MLQRRRQWQPTPVLLPGESHGQRSLVGCSLWGRTESDMTEATWQLGMGLERSEDDNLIEPFCSVLLFSYSFVFVLV